MIKVIFSREAGRRWRCSEEKISEMKIEKNQYITLENEEHEKNVILKA